MLYSFRLEFLSKAKNGMEESTTALGQILDYAPQSENYARNDKNTMNQHLAAKTIPWLIGMLSALVGRLVLGGWALISLS